jgi:group I intron endonuclease
MIIYKATNLINGKCYVGQTTKDFEKYKNSHIKNALNGYEKTFYDAIRKHGKDNFKWEILKENIKDKLMLNLMETFMIMVHHSHISESGYNKTWGGDGGPCSEETKEKIRQSLIGKEFTDERKKNVKIHL